MIQLSSAKAIQPLAYPRRASLALMYGVGCHVAFVLGVGAMIFSMYYGMSRTKGSVPPPWQWPANVALLVQFFASHSFLLTRPGQAVLAKMAPAGVGARLGTTTYALIASLQLMLLFTLWTPSGVVWWQAQGSVLWLTTSLYAVAWLLLLKSIVDAGIELQTGMLGWRAVYRGVAPIFPDMPTTGLFRWMRQPIYLSFALTLWTVPTWTPDQLLVSLVLTAYCLAGPLFKERRFLRRYDARFAAYQAATPYWLPRMWKRRRGGR